MEPIIQNEASVQEESFFDKHITRITVWLNFLYSAVFCFLFIISSLATSFFWKDPFDIYLYFCFVQLIFPFGVLILGINNFHNKRKEFFYSLLFSIIFTVVPTGLLFLLLAITMGGCC